MAAPDAVKILFPRPLDSMNMLFAAGETIAHLEHLVRLGELEKESMPDAAVSYRATHSMPLHDDIRTSAEDIHF